MSKESNLNHDHQTNQVDQYHDQTSQVFVTKPIIKSSLYFSKCGKYLIFQKTEKHIFSAKYHLKLIDEQLSSRSEAL